MKKCEALSVPAARKASVMHWALFLLWFSLWLIPGRVYGIQDDSIDSIINSLVNASDGHGTQYCYKILATRKSEALPAVIHMLQTGNIWEKQSITKFIQYSRWPEVSDDLISIASDPKEHFLSRQGALYALGEIGDTNTIGTVILPILNEPGCPGGVQQVAISVLARIGYKRAVPDIRRFAGHENSNIRLFAYRALAGFGEPVDTKFLLSSLKSQDYVVRQDACGALSEVSGDSITNALSLVAENDSNESVRSIAKTGLLARQIRNRTATEKLDTLLTALESAERRTIPWIIKTILKEGGPKGREHILKLAGRDDKTGERSRSFLIADDPSLSTQILVNPVQDNGKGNEDFEHAASPTHQTLMEFGVKKAGSLSPSLSFNATQQLRMKEGVVDEDKTSDILGEHARYQQHFYRPVTKTGLLNFTDARTRAYNIWTGKMIPYFANGYLNQQETSLQWGGAWQQLGRLSHLLQDMSSPLHVSGIAHGSVSCKFEKYWEDNDVILRTTLNSIGGPLHSSDPLPSEALAMLDKFTQDRLKYRFNSNCPQKDKDDVRGWLEVLSWVTYFRTTFWGEVQFGTTGNGTSGPATTSQTTAATFNDGYVGAKPNTLHTMFNGNVKYIDGWTDNYYEITDRMGYVFRWKSSDDIDDWSSCGNAWAMGKKDSSIRLGGSSDDTSGARITGRFWFDTRELGKKNSGTADRRCFPKKYPNGDPMTDDLHRYYGKTGYPLTARYNAGLLGLANRSITVKTNSGTATVTLGRKDNFGRAKSFSTGTAGTQRNFVAKSPVSLAAAATNSSGWPFSHWEKNGSTNSSNRSVTINQASDWIGRSGDIWTAVYEASYKCGAYVAPDVWKKFDCYNLTAIGKTSNDDPFTPSWRLIGGYWQWGRKGLTSSLRYATNTANFAHGPTGSDAGSANSGSINGWSHTDAPNGAWSDASKTDDDPCPAGYRVPTKSQWDGVWKINNQITVGTWSTTWDNHTNYSSARFFGDDLMLPATGHRRQNDGSLYGRGGNGHYWSSSEYAGYTSHAWFLYFDSNYKGTNYISRQYGFSVRCIAE